jgi:hypothetical protein
MKIGALIFPLLLVIVAVYLLYKKLWRSSSWKKPATALPDEWRSMLLLNVNYYNNLSDEGKKHFEFKVHEFIYNCKITGVNTDVKDLDRVLIASSAVIPIFSFPDWNYSNIDEVLLYPGEFDSAFNTDGDGRNIAGMVGTGYMEGKMILSKSALHHGFKNSTDKKNTAIHEFVHLIDKSDGSIDGIPELLLDKQFVIPWLDLIHKKIIAIEGGEANINPYGATNQVEFFAVISEYFFERPQLLKQKHPQLYEYLKQIFKQDVWYKRRKTQELRRNDLCPCGSGKKYKYCCLRKS